MALITIRLYINLISDPAVNNKYLDLNLNGSFSNGNKEENGEVLMNMQAFSKPQQETTGVIENVRNPAYFYYFK